MNPTDTLRLAMARWKQQAGQPLTEAEREVLRFFGNTPVRRTFQTSGRKTAAPNARAPMQRKWIQRGDITVGTPVPFRRPA